MKKGTRILLTGGGTAGHVNPALAIGAALAEEGSETLFVGVRGRAEEQVVPKEGIPIRFVRASGFPGARPSPAFARFLLDLAVGTIQAAGILLRFRPDVLVGTGGFASAPVIFAATLLKKLRLLRSRVFVHEQNAVPGKLNRLVGRYAEKVFVTFPETLSLFPGNGAVTGYPLRKRIGHVSKEEARSRLDFALPEGRTVVFVFGGSQGSRSLNRGLVDALGELLPHADRLFLVHGTGLFKGGGYDAGADTAARLAARYTPEERERIDSFYVSRSYFHDIASVYAVSDLVVIRGGSGSLNEVARMGLPALVVPKANLPGDHQVANARALERAGGAEVLYEETVLRDGHLAEELDGSLLARRVLDLVDDPDRLAEMSRMGRDVLGADAAAEIAHHVRHGHGTGTLEPTLVPAPHVVSNAALLSRLEKAYAAEGRRYRVEAHAEARDLPWFRSRAASLLANESWEVRNLGVKLLGLLGATEKVPLLLALLADRTPAPLLQRLLGGDFAQVGFVRRNAFTALGRLGVVDAGVEAALLAGLSDPYWEVRAEAARTAARFAGLLSRRADVVAALVGGLSDRNLEAAAAAAEALGAIGGEADALPALLRLSDYRFWKVRAAALRGVLALVERGEARDRTKLEAALPGFLLTSTDFRPQFEMKLSYRRVLEALSRGKESPR
ncbi:MAG TPA: UDP-N-acetylglucosamine--N-acetylmuramyl-(pentapeptide) pyrophosphoryl-undecaprenol N-acetylglucosamine transferase [Thermoanaerobaculia bacterium]|nr:UDP-N-acetylglucosamine--N-acetylmuramyl-(pentapeptide) pyrophosphoryl-undecaprenol N-acetylglucosamine transferase [Thermoanaerobaculia bacterium]